MTEIKTQQKDTAKVSNSLCTLAVDLGGTKINAGRFEGAKLVDCQRRLYDASQPADVIDKSLIEAISRLFTPQVKAIGIGVPGVVDTATGTVFHTVNIPSWQQKPLKAMLEKRFGCPVVVNNDSNCFALGESLLGEAERCTDVIGVCLGTGFGVGIVNNRRLFVGQNCGAGEIGSMSYLDANLDVYCSGQFFQRYYQLSGEDVCNAASRGEQWAVDAFAKFGAHIAHAIKQILFAFDPKIIVFGGSVSHAFPYFIDATWSALQDFPFSKTLENLELVQSQNANSALLGAAQLAKDTVS